jgi:hypothetical protein
MAMTWGRWRRRIDKNEQTASNELDEHGSRASEDRRERQKLRQTLDAEVGRTNPRQRLYDLGGPLG